MVYSSYGLLSTDSGSVQADYVSYTGREAERDLNVYYYRARYYDPLTGRFMVRDPLGFAACDVNLYRYVGNAPVGLNDPFGLYSLTQFGYDMAAFWVGVGDAASLGLTEWVRRQSWYGDSYVNTCSGWYTGGRVTGYVAGSFVAGAGVARGVRVIRAVRATRAARVTRISNHAATRLAQRGITERMAETVVRRGAQYYDRLHGTFSYVLEHGMASGNSIVVATNIATGRITTAMIHSHWNEAVRMTNGILRYVRIR